MADSSNYGRWLSTPPSGEEVVISGISGRFPESNNVSDFRENLFTGKDMVTEASSLAALNHPQVPKRKGQMPNTDKLDAGFFGIHHRQADNMNPGMRKVLETAVEAVMDAGVNLSEMKGRRTGVFVATVNFGEMAVEALFKTEKPQNFGVTGYYRSFLAHRISYLLKLRGVSICLDNACSSSGDVLDAAFGSIRSGKCEDAIVVGCSLLEHPSITLQFYRMGFVSDDGRCKTFDEKADGYVRSEATVAIFLQKAKNARRNYGQIIHIKTSTDGFKEEGITYPSGKIQQLLITDILEESRIDPTTIDYIEAHGTGTKVGDPEEVASIDNSIAKKRTKPLLVGSVKSNMGHSEPCSGLCSLVKLIIAMETGYIAPNINFNKLKPGLIGFEEGRMKVVTKLTKLENEEAILGFNNFGYGGGNSCVFVKRFGKVKNEECLDFPVLVCVSGRTEQSVSVLLDDMLSRTLDGGYVGLMHQIFKTRTEGHIYRGFAVVDQNGLKMKSVRDYTQKPKSLYVFFGDFSKTYKTAGKELQTFAIFKTTIKTIQNSISCKKFNILENIFDSGAYSSVCAFAVALGVVELLKLLDLDPVVVDLPVDAYYSRTKSLEDVINSNFDNTKVSSLRISKNATVLNLSNKTLRQNSEDLTVSGNVLETLGKLYEQGFNPQIHKLYPPVQFPVSRNTPMISPLLLWNYDKSWHTYKFDGFHGSGTLQQEYLVSSKDDQKYLAGHIVDGRNLIPATEYLSLVWQTVASSQKLLPIDVPVVFENCKFIRAMVIPKDGYAKLIVSIQTGTGDFEVVDKNSVVASGRVYKLENQKHFSDLPSLGLEGECLEHEEIYQELYLRGCNHEGLFKGLKKCTIDASSGLIQWENNWTSYLDNILQMSILRLNTRQLYVLVGLRKLVIDPQTHIKWAEAQGLLCPVYNYKSCNVIRSGGVEILGFRVSSLLRKKNRLKPILEKRVFIPNFVETSLEVSARINTQIILENCVETSLKAVEIVDDYSRPDCQLLLPLVHKATSDVPLVTTELIVSSAKASNTTSYKVENFVFTPVSNLVLIVGTRLLQREEFLKHILKALKPDGFIISREGKDVVPENLEQLEFLTQHSTESEKLILLRKLDQTRKNIVSKVYKDGKWGTYRRLLLEDVLEVKREHCYVSVISPGDLSSLKWIEGPLTKCTKVEKKKILVYPYYSAVNSRDVVIASGRSNFDPFTKNTEKEFLGFEFCGLDSSGHRVMGISNQALSTLVVADGLLFWQIPDDWSLEDGSTVPVAYATVLYSLFWVIKLKPGMSVLVHSATDGIAMAALHVCSYWNCTTFITVDCEDKRNYLEKNVPEASDARIILKNKSLEQTVDMETEGRGVDVVLNFDQEDLEPALRCVVSGGHFITVEIHSGSDSTLELVPVDKNVSYHTMVMDSLQPSDTKKWVVERIGEGIRRGYVKPLPRTVFEFEDTEEAFRRVANGDNVEKYLIKIRDDTHYQSVEDSFLGTPKFYCSLDKSYIIFGEPNGFGLELAEWLLSRNARKLVFVLSSGKQTSLQKRRIQNWMSYGATVRVWSKSFTTRENCLELINEANTLGFVDGIFDVSICKTQKSLASRSKVVGHLDQVSRKYCPQLRYFVVFSSISSSKDEDIGICQERKDCGLPALAIQWGAIESFTPVSTNGFIHQTISSCLEVLDKFLMQDNPVVTSTIVADKEIHTSNSAFTVVAHILGVRDIEGVASNRTLAELGTDSITANEIMQLLEKDFGIHVTPKEVPRLTFEKLQRMEEDLKKLSKFKILNDM